MLRWLCNLTSVSRITIGRLYTHIIHRNEILTLSNIHQCCSRRRCILSLWLERKRVSENIVYGRMNKAGSSLVIMIYLICYICQNSMGLDEILIDEHYMLICLLSYILHTCDISCVILTSTVLHWSLNFMNINQWKV